MVKELFLWYNLNMFLDQKEPVGATLPPPHPEAPKPLIGRTEFIIIAVIAGIIVLGGGGWWYWTHRTATPEPTPIISEPKDQGALPGTLVPIEEENNANTNSNSNVKAENIAFGSFYTAKTETIDYKISSVKLPLNVKSQVSNYYELARKVNIDPIIDNLNHDGFATLDNPFPKSSNDFYGTYAELSSRAVPVIITGDFLLYYYQNSLKQIYKEIESSFFYESMWRVTQSMYETANGRYQDRRQKLGVASDPLLEAERLEAAYFAAGLMLLQPEANQISATEDLNDSRKFKPSEARRFEFTAPSYLTDDVEKEVALIKEGKQKLKSPALLYERDYKEFVVPTEYTRSAKLRNFYLASRWYASLFPLYYKDASCANCLLDREDWIINQTAAHLVAADLSADQGLKNEWAKIYKVISYFSGLRSELTYLHFQSIRESAFPGKSVEEIFGSGSFDRLISMRDQLAKISFNAAEGSYSRTDKVLHPYLGMRLLQTSYWPNRSFYDQLTYDAVGTHKVPTINNKRASYLSSCQEGDKLVRCKALGYDILNAVLRNAPSSKFLIDNTNYSLYSKQLDSLKSTLQKFDVINWHSNNFWTTLHIASSFANASVSNLPYNQTQHWLERKVSSSLSALTNLVLPADTWQLPREQSRTGLEVSGADNSFNYIEPDNALADELVANTKMLFDTLVALGVVKDNDVRLTDLLNRMNSSRAIIYKELKGESLSLDEYQFIKDFSGQLRTESIGAKETSIQFTNPKNGRVSTIKQTIAPLKLMFLIYDKGGKRILAAGPIFSYKEQ